MNIKFKEKTLILVWKQMLTSIKEFMSSTKISAKTNQEIHALGGKINLYYGGWFPLPVRQISFKNRFIAIPMAVVTAEAVVWVIAIILMKINIFIFVYGW